MVLIFALDKCLLQVTTTTSIAICVAVIKRIRFGIITDKFWLIEVYEKLNYGLQ